MRKKGLLQNISYALVANIFNAAATMVTSLLIPRAFGSDLDAYGYYQIYFFYVSYVGFFHFGLCDGILLRIGGMEYSDLQKDRYASQFWLLLLAECVISAGIMLVVRLTTATQVYTYIYFMVCLNLVVLNLQTYLLYILQGTSRIKEYSFITISYRALYCAFIIVALLLKYADLHMYVAIDLVSKFLSVIVGVYWCKEIIFQKFRLSKELVREIFENISSGVKLLIANISGLLTNGIVRIGIQSHWDVATYGKVSLSLTLTHAFLTIVNAVSLVLYPTLRRTNKARIPSFYRNTRNVLVYLMAACFILYYPICQVLGLWLPQYSDSLIYLGILLPMSLYSVKASLLVNTLLKVYRQEKTIMTANLVSIIVAVLTTAVSIYVFNSLDMALFAILLNTMVKTMVSDWFLSKVIDVKIAADLIEELLIAVVFVVSSWIIGGYVGMGIYFASLIVLFLFRGKRFVSSLKETVSVSLKA